MTQVQLEGTGGGSGRDGACKGARTWQGRGQADSGNLERERRGGDLQDFDRGSRGRQGKCRSVR
eukprot:752110-Hanusia_phi.AAC.7